MLRGKTVKDYSEGENHIAILEEDRWALLAMLQHIQEVLKHIQNEVINECITR